MSRPGPALAQQLGGIDPLATYHYADVGTSWRNLCGARRRAMNDARAGSRSGYSANVRFVTCPTCLQLLARDIARRLRAK